MIGVGFGPNVQPAVAALRRARTAVSGPVPNGPYRDGLRQAGMTYLRSQVDRFARNAAGGGDWPPLKPSTLRKKTKPTRKGILRVTDELFRSMTPGAPGNVLTDIPSGVRVGTAVQHGVFHMKRTKNRAARPPMAPPDIPTATQMRRDIAVGLGLQAQQWAKIRLAVSAAAPDVRFGVF